MCGGALGDDRNIGAFVEVPKNAAIGRGRKITSHTVICAGFAIEDDVFVGHGVMLINDLYFRATAHGRLQTEVDWGNTHRCEMWRVDRSGPEILGGETIAEGALIGAGAVVANDIPDHKTAKEVPARLGRTVSKIQPLE